MKANQALRVMVDYDRVYIRTARMLTFHRYNALELLPPLKLKRLRWIQAEWRLYFEILFCAQFPVNIERIRLILSLSHEFGLQRQDGTLFRRRPFGKNGDTIVIMFGLTIYLIKLQTSHKILLDFLLDLDLSIDLFKVLGIIGKILLQDGCPCQGVSCLIQIIAIGRVFIGLIFNWGF